jgi:hypothetical protein
VVVVGTAVVGTLVVGAGFAVASYLGGGGTQPEEVLPGDTIAYAKVDLDPAMSQKTAALSLLQRFPDLDDGEGSDLTGTLLSPLLEDGTYGLDFETDIEPWLGDRIAVAAVPAPGADLGMTAVTALAVDDDRVMADALRAARDDADFGFAVRDGYVLLAESQDTADRLADDERTLADDADFAGDREALGGDRIAVAWADLPAAQTALAASPAFAEVTGGMGLDGEEFSGRLILGVHAEADALVMEGLDFSVSDVGPGPQADGPTQLVHELPEDTLAALSMSDLGELATTAWEKADASGALQEELESLGFRHGARRRRLRLRHRRHHLTGHGRGRRRPRGHRPVPRRGR